MKKGKKLVLFDIDGTLLIPVRPSEAVQRFPYALNKAFGIQVILDYGNWKYNGVVDRGILFDMVQTHGVTKADLIRMLPDIEKYFCEYLNLIIKDGPLYARIDDAHTLVQKLASEKSVIRGLLTGNLGEAARWKLRSVGYQEEDFLFGVYGHQTDDRISLAKVAQKEAKKHLGRYHSHQDIIVIGDTAHDIRCGKAIGAFTIAVTTGVNVPLKSLTQEAPDLLVDSLLDEQVLGLLGLTKGKD
jgi:phosphoglycolate phosphatase